MGNASSGDDNGDKDGEDDDGTLLLCSMLVFCWKKALSTLGTASIPDVNETFGEEKEKEGGRSHRRSFSTILILPLPSA